jgi:hypothetical protein
MAVDKLTAILHIQLHLRTLFIVHTVSRCLLKLGVDAHHARVTVGDLPAIRVFWEKVSIF